MAPMREPDKNSYSRKTQRRIPQVLILSARRFFSLRRPETGIPRLAMFNLASRLRDQELWVIDLNIAEQPSFSMPLIYAHIGVFVEC